MERTAILDLSYPRKTGYCKGHHVAKHIPFSKEYLSVALAYLVASDADLVRGDLVIFDSADIYRNNGLAVYTGSKVIGLYYKVDDYGSIPPEFRPVEENIPLRYWCTNPVANISHNTIVWVSTLTVTKHVVQKPVYNSMISTALKRNSRQKFVYTVFECHNKQYTLVYVPDTDQHITVGNTLSGADNVAAFTVVLNSGKVIPVEVESPIEDLTGIMSDNTLYYIA